MESKHLLLVEDDPNFGSVMKDYLELHDYKVTLAKDGEQGLLYFKSKPYDLCILDVMMPKKDGFALATDIRKLDKNTPIIFLTAKTLKEDVLRGYQVGGDDYLNKPFDSEVLLFKIKVILQRKSDIQIVDNEQFKFDFGRFTFNSKLRQLSFDGQEPEILSPKENKLLKMLLFYKDDLMPRELALSKIWKDDNYFSSRSMDVYIAKLRKYLKADKNVEIINIHGEGFRLVDRK